MPVNVSVQEAISQFEMRIGGYLQRIGEKVEVTNLRPRGEAYVADITRITRNFKKPKYVRERETEVELVVTTCHDVMYDRNYIDLLRKFPVYNEDYSQAMREKKEY